TQGGGRTQGHAEFRAGAGWAPVEARSAQDHPVPRGTLPVGASPDQLISKDFRMSMCESSRTSRPFARAFSSARTGSEGSAPLPFRRSTLSAPKTLEHDLRQINGISRELAEQIPRPYGRAEEGERPP